MSMFLIIMSILFLVFELSKDHQATVNFIKWVFITYCGADVGSKLVDKIGGKK